MHQLNEDAQLLLFDSCCLWLWIREKMASAFPGTVLEQHDKLFEQGLPGLNASNCFFLFFFLGSCQTKHDRSTNIFGNTPQNVIGRQISLAIPPKT